MPLIPSSTNIGVLSAVGTCAAGGATVLINAFEPSWIITSVVLISTTGGAGALYITLPLGSKLHVTNAPAANTAFPLANLAVPIGTGLAITVHNSTAGACDYVVSGYLDA